MKLLMPALLALAVSACAVGPDYKRPSVETPGGYRRAASDTNAPAGTPAFADLGWWQVFKDLHIETTRHSLPHDCGPLVRARVA